MGGPAGGTATHIASNQSEQKEKRQSEHPALMLEAP